MKHLKAIYFVILAVIIMIPLSLNFKIVANENDIIRVGFFNYSNFYDLDEDGYYTGYFYEYLQEIAKYTNWKYQYVNTSFSECLEMLKKGEIDILAPIKITDENRQYYDYATYEFVDSYTTISVLKDNEEILYQDFESLNGAKIGMLKENTQNELLESFCKENKLVLKSIIYYDQAVLKQALIDGEIDGILSSNLIIDKDERAVAQFSSQKEYIATTKGNKDILEKLNIAQSQIKINSPYFEFKLYQKYYSNKINKTVPFTTLEKQFIENNTIKAVYNPISQPFEYYDENTNTFKGINSDIFKLISEYSGLKFEFIHTESYAESLKKVKNQEADIICSIFNNESYTNSYDIITTNVFLETPMVLVKNVQNSKKTNKILALPLYYMNMKNSFKSECNIDQVILYDSIYECLDNVESNKVDFTFTNKYLADYLLTNYKYKNLSIVSMSKNVESLSIGVSNTKDKLLLSILNKTINNIETNAINEVIINNTSSFDNFSFSKYIKSNYIIVILIFLLISLVIISVLIYIIMNNSEHNKKIQELLYKDTLTGMWNINKFRIESKKILTNIQNNTSINYAIVYTDIEKFHSINDNYGYATGDKILISFSKYIKDNSYPNEAYARISADNFIGLLKFTNKDNFIERLENYKNSLEKCCLDENVITPVTIICGIYVIEKDETDIIHMIDNANYVRKTLKGSDISALSFYDSCFDSNDVNVNELERDMVKALENGEFIPYYQPKFDLITNEITGAEALVRWIHPVRGYLSPDKFIPTFEKNGFIVNMDFYIFEQVCIKIKEWLDSGKTIIPISTNFSREHIKNSNFLNNLQEIVKKYNVPLNFVEIEITESTMLENTDTLISIMQELKKIGFLLSMDDFGAGYSSLSLLNRLPVDVLKLDKEFLGKKVMSDKDQIIIEGFVSIAKKLNIKVVSEGVETESQAEFLRNIGCDTGQGYLFSKPIPIIEFEKMLFGD